jgi:hypothetical protein
MQALALVAVFVAVVAAAIAFLRPPKQDFDNLDIALSGGKLSIAVPNCDMNRLQDKFFLHIYPSTPKPGAQAFIGQDFDLASLPKRENAGSSGQCVVERPIDIPDVKKVDIGQLNMPGGLCCTIIWSRTIPAKP